MVKETYTKIKPVSKYNNGIKEKLFDIVKWGDEMNS